MTQRFLDKIVVVTGGNSGIGLASAKAFASEGAKVVITGRDSETLMKASQEIGNGALAYRTDISDPQQIAELFAIVHESVGRIDVLFVNAGVAALLPVESVTEDEWDRIHDINLKGAFFSVQAALPLMSSGSAIVLNSSMAAHKGLPNNSVYASSKAGLCALGRCLAAEMIVRGIRVNVVSPGPAETPLFERIEGVAAEAVQIVRQKTIEIIPMKRMGTPEEVAAAVLFLASDAAAFITGVDLLVDSGAASFFNALRG